MITEKIKNHTIKDSIGNLKFFIIRNFIEPKTYDKIYECFNNTSHKHWSEVKENNKFVLKEQFWHLSEINSDFEENKWIGYWFFKQRGDRRAIQYKVASPDGESNAYHYHGNVLLLISPNQHKIKMQDVEISMPVTPVCKIVFETDESRALDRLFE